MYFFEVPPADATNLNRGGTNIPVTGYKAAVFLPDGRLYLGNTTITPVVYLRNDTPGPPPENYYKIIVNQATGVPAIRRP